MDSRVWALGPLSQSLLEDLGAWNPDDRICAYQSMRVIDARSDAGLLSLIRRSVTWLRPIGFETSY